MTTKSVLLILILVSFVSCGIFPSEPETRKVELIIRAVHGDVIISGIQDIGFQGIINRRVGVEEKDQYKYTRNIPVGKFIEIRFKIKGWTAGTSGISYAEGELYINGKLIDEDNSAQDKEIWLFGWAK